MKTVIESINELRKQYGISVDPTRLEYLKECAVYIEESKGGVGKKEGNN
jgi:hypothetical protein